MLTQIKYSPKTYLKDVVEALRKRTPPEELITVNTADRAAVDMKNAVYNYWWFSEIGCDFQETFVQRVQTYWLMYFYQYRNVLEAIRVNGISNGYVKTKDITNENTFTAGTNRAETVARSGEDSFSRTQTDTILERQSQNSKVTSQLDNETTYGSSVTTNTNNTGSNTNENTTSLTETFSEITPEMLRTLDSEESVLKSFVMRFAPLFMEVL